MRIDGRNERIKNKERGFGSIQPVENRFISMIGAESTQGTKVTVKISKVKYCKNRGFFEAA
ncbi:hypothetical protein NEMIN01_0266 [Nematocida minor]|uniref:uncharacterized protein n=1 Tax=Nematocida minor TaxID=1912983 RepID=UPI00221FF046|nr:uncharacterized protein NEMIN01_0266 [Nematocida minor]KAI5189100.1 hypothetical protein NEMIN01_0266 [Nematocida minor]